MLSRRLLRNFANSSRYNPLKGLTDALKAPRKHVRMAVQPEGIDKQSWGNQTAEAFDEVSQEWQAAITANTYDLHTQQYLDATIQPNFGTVDNPHVIVTSDAPFRYVSCTGQPNEDDYEGHESMIFMLREGPLQRCPQCGQVYKLVRLRDEYSDEMDYYKTSTVPLDVEEMGEADHWQHNSLIRMMPQSWEHSVFEQKSNNVYSLVNPDDHDRILVDPAYRMEKIKTAEEKSNIFDFSLRLLDQAYKNKNPPSPQAIHATEYENLHEAEVSIARLDRIFQRMTRFHSREYLDMANHERRERRMRARRGERVRDSYTVYFGGMSEEEAQYRDYFETDLEANPDNEFEANYYTEQKVTDQEYMRLENWDFQQVYTHNPEQSSRSTLDRRLFEFKYRRANDSAENYNRRENRVHDLSLTRFSQPEVKQLFNDLASARNSGNQTEMQEAEAKVLKLFAQEGVNQFKDYYQTDSDEVTEMVGGLPDTDLTRFLDTYTDYARGVSSIRGTYSIPKRKWNKGLGFWSNVMAEVQDYRGFVAPKVAELTNQLNLLEAEIYTRDLAIEGTEKVDNLLD